MQANAARMIALLLALASCTSRAPMDACPPSDAFCPPPPPPDPASVPAPVVSCDYDAGRPGDPCLRYVHCQDSWTATYVDGTCVDQQCSFTEPPTFIYCVDGCIESLGHCAHPGPTAP